MLIQRSIAANTTFYMAALTIQKALSFLYFTFLARSLGSVTTGKYFFTLSLAGIVVGIMDLGVTPMLIRDVAKDTGHASSLVSQSITLKAVLAALLGVGALVVVPNAFVDATTRHLVYLAFIIAVFDSFALTFFAAIRAHRNLAYESVSAVLFYLVVIVLGGMAISNGYDVRIVTAVIAVAGLVNMVFSYAVLTRRLNMSVRFLWDVQLIRRIVYAAAPFAAAALFVKVYAYLDTMFLKFFSGDEAVGLYSVPYKLTFAFQFIPMAFVAALYPAFSHAWKNNRDDLTAVFTKAVSYLMVIAVPIAAGIIALAPQIIMSVYTDAYRLSVTPLIILMVSLPFLFINFPIGSLLNASDRQTRQTAHLGVTMVLNAGLNLFLIPRYGTIGAAVSSTISTVFIFLLGMYVAVPLVRVAVLPLAVTAIKVSAVALLMAGVVLALKNYVPWYLTVVPGMLVYGVLMHVSGVVTAGDAKRFLMGLRQ